MKQKYNNPIIRGFNPDPSICRVGEWFYLVTSTFEFFPGVPIYRSKNLAQWECIGHCLTRESQLDLKGCVPSGGIYAPTLRYHEGRFYMVTTNVSGKGNFIVHTDDIEGEWSDPVWIDQKGIDPSLLFADGKTYFVSNGDEQWNPGIFMCEINPDTGEKLTESRLISNGCIGRSAEAPHVYKIGSIYYLMLAEGGTEYGHMVTVSRSENPYGPYEPCPYNPILSHRETERMDITCTGHADLAEDQNGNWWMAALAVRGLAGQTGMLMLHNLGRETFLTSVKWKDGWPITGKDGRLYAEMEGTLPATYAPQQKKRTRNLADMVKSHSLTWVRNPNKDSYTVDTEKDAVTLTGDGNTLSQEGISPTFVGIRQEEFLMEMEVKTELSPDSKQGIAGISIFYNNEHHYEVFTSCKNGKRYVGVRKQIYDFSAVTVCKEITTADPVILCVKANKEYYTFFYRTIDTQEEDIQKLDQGTTAALCSEITRRMTFTGTFAGLFAEKTAADFYNWKAAFTAE